MKTFQTMTAFVLFLMADAAFADGQGKVRPDPQKACRGFKPHELCFERPREGVARVEYLEPFLENSLGIRWELVQLFFEGFFKTGEQTRSRI